MTETTAAMTFTEPQIDDWRRYERVRKSGRYNMFSPEARRDTKLDAERYAFVMKNYSAMKAQADSDA